MTGSARSLIISMVLVALGAVIWLALVPRPSKVDAPTADVTGIARERSRAQQWSLAYPQGLPSGWRPVNVRMLPAQNEQPTWQAGYDGPNGGYAAVLQTSGKPTSWMRSQTDGAAARGMVTIGGTGWAKVEKSDPDQRSLVRTAPLNGLTTVVTGTGSWEQLQQFAAALKPGS
ncbi:DUF4245 domain-containing protein [Calidifontibacter sp. DB0510]|uniref:DUF4245 domain-containing protein n=1 Tax=Metallococcus carri TaxID=1656884 RepID=A0A967EGJ0_9MICO|nr:DUF4245 domain-containing protein [Metallococcus carri]NHN55128.1 DUF4245 domain-containing protein [Metallococcus carri]NOP36205.1 DUF4245 family protein [Calidifontibacter sp. DB2511S]